MLSLEELFSRITDLESKLDSNCNHMHLLSIESAASQTARAISYLLNKPLLSKSPRTGGSSSTKFGQLCTSLTEKLKISWAKCGIEFDGFTISKDCRFLRGASFLEISSQCQAILDEFLELRGLSPRWADYKLSVFNKVLWEMMKCRAGGSRKKGKSRRDQVINHDRCIEKSTEFVDKFLSDPWADEETCQEVIVGN